MLLLTQLGISRVHTHPSVVPCKALLRWSPLLQKQHTHDRGTETEAKPKRSLMVYIDRASPRSGGNERHIQSTSITGFRHADKSPLSSRVRLNPLMRSSSREKRIINADFNSCSAKTSIQAVNRSLPTFLSVRRPLSSIFSRTSNFERKDCRSFTTQVTKPAKGGGGKAVFLG